MADGPSLARQIFSVLLVFSLLALALWKLRRGSASVNFATPWKRSVSTTRSLDRVERLALTPQHSLHLIRVQGREILIATHPQGCSFISERAKGPGE